MHATPSFRLPLAGGLLAAALACSAHAQGLGYVNFESPQSHPLDRTPSGSVLLAVNTADNRLEVFDLVGGLPVRRGSVEVGLDPVSVRARSETEAWVVNQISDSVSVVDLPTMRVVRTINVGDEPADVVFAGAPQRAFVSLSVRAQIVVLDPANPAGAPQTVTVPGAQPRALAASPDGSKVYLAIFESGNHSTLLPEATVSSGAGPYGGQNPPPNSGTTFSPPIAAGLPAPPVVSHIVRKRADGTWRDGNNRNWTALVNWDVHDNDLVVIDAASLSMSPVKGLMNIVAGLGVGPDGTVLAVGTEAVNEVRFEENLNGVFVRVVGAFVAGGGGSATVVDLNPHLDYSTATVAQALRNQSVGDPRGVAWMPSGTMAWVAGMGSNSVVGIAPSGARVATVGVGEGPTGVVLDADASRLYVLNRFEASVSTVDTGTRAEIARTSFFDPTPFAVKEGRPFLYDTHLTSGLGQASCASCHVDGRADRIAWDLGSPQGTVTSFNEVCQAPAGCLPWHPMKGPMVTQTLVGIIGNEPFHWRGEKTDLAAFNVAYTALQGRESQITAAQMQRLTTYVDSLTFPPNPNRNLDGSLRTALTISNGQTGNAVNGQNIFNTAPLLGPPPSLTCVACHAGLDGTNNRVDIPGPGDDQNKKNVPLRDVYRKTGADRASQVASRGFGFDHDGEEATLQNLLNIGFNFPAGANGQAQRRDVEAFVLSFGTDTFAAVGAQTTASNGGGAGDDTARIQQFITFATAGQAGLVVKGRVGGIQRGYALVGGSFQSDRAAETLSPAALLALSGPGSELTYTLVPAGTERRIGIDRDRDGHLDRDELDAGADPADPASFPGLCAADLAPAGGDGRVDGADLAFVLAQWGSSGGSADLNHDGVVNGSDLGVLLGAWGPCN
ncbi:MAG: hypothetical protein U0625_05015 [Phycisphaerales bacterium]